MKRNIFWKALRPIVALKIGWQNALSSLQTHLIDFFLPVVALNKIRIPIKAFSDFLLNFHSGRPSCAAFFSEQCIITLKMLSSKSS